MTNEKEELLQQEIDELEEKTLATLKGSPFNKLRMCIFPKHYAYNENEPIYHPFERDGEGGWDFSRFNPAKKS